MRAIGFDDAPFARRRGAPVVVCGAVCAGTRFEGLVWGRVRKDGFDATGELCRLLVGRKFLPQLHWVLLDGIAFGGFNLVDLPALAEALNRPCVAVMRRAPNLLAIEAALKRLTRRRSGWSCSNAPGPSTTARRSTSRSAAPTPTRRTPRCGTSPTKATCPSPCAWRT